MLRLALDWTSNTTHAALLVAEGAGFNAARGLRVAFVEPTHVDAPATPLDGVVDGSVDAGIAPCDQVLSEYLGLDRVSCVAALTAADISAVCVQGESSASRPRDLSGLRYGSCGYPLELACLRSMIEKDGGSGDVVEVCPRERPQTEELLLQGHVDCAWMYRSWEVLRAEQAGISVRQFRPTECGVPFGYMNTIVFDKRFLAGPAGKQTVRLLLAAAADGAQWAMADPARAGRLLASMVGSCGIGATTGLEDADFNRASLEKMIELGALAPARSSGRRWGEMQPSRWADFVAWAEGASEDGLDGRRCAKIRKDALPDDRRWPSTGHAAGRATGMIGPLFTNEYLRPPLPSLEDAQYHVTG